MLEDALSTAADLRRALEAEVERARHEREALRTLDSARLFASATARAAFNAEVARLESALAARLARAAGALGLPEVTLARLALRAPAEAAALAALLADVRSLAAALAELDRLNLALAGRAAACVQGYLNALSPTPAAYDRRGLRSAGASRSAVSTRG
jgi:regulator of sirC expression with transglutaminase-like and TPR domain